MGQADDAEPKQLNITGISGIDTQHGEFIALYDELLDYLGKEALSFDFVYDSLQKIMKNLKSHFSTEEKLMEMTGFPGAEKHKSLHKKLYKQFSDTVKAVKKTKDINITDIVRAMRDADMEHIRLYDAEYVSHVENLITLGEKYNITSVRAQTLIK